jgi:hypothetical protein
MNASDFSLGTVRYRLVNVISCKDLQLGHDIRRSKSSQADCSPDFLRNYRGPLRARTYRMGALRAPPSDDDMLALRL